MKGFTLLEILLSLAIIGVITGMGIPLYHNLQIRTDQDTASSHLIQMSRRAQELSEGVKTDTSWGVHIDDQFITLFRGTDYSSRDPAYDEIYAIPETVNFTGDQEYTYSRMDGRLSSAVSINVEAPEEETINIDINQAGTIEYW